jgi:protein TonB
LELLQSELRKAVEAHVAALKDELSANLASARRAGGAAMTRVPATGVPATGRSIRPAVEKEAAHAPLNVDSALAPTNAMTRELKGSAAADPVESLSGSGAPDTQAVYADVEHSYETAAQQIALHARERADRKPAVVPAPLPPSLDQPSASAGRGPELPSPAVLKAVKLVEPQYPQAAQVRGIEGWVDLTLTVAASGDVIDARVEEREGSRSFERAALLAVRQWKYEPFGAPDSNVAPREIPVRVGFRLE